MLQVMRGWISIYTRQASCHTSWLLRQPRTSTPQKTHDIGQQSYLSTKADHVKRRAVKHVKHGSHAPRREDRHAQDLPRSPYIEKKTAAYRSRGHKPQEPFHTEQEETSEEIYEEPSATPPQEFLPPRGPKLTLNKSFKRAPFSTRFSMNPFAHALATPIREDNLTGAHLPTSCLVDFSLLETDTESGAKTLLPLSIAEALIPRKKKNARLNEQEREIRERYAEERMSVAPTYANSYALNSADAISYISGDKRPQSFVLSRRIRENISKGILSDKQISWRGDMPEFLLSALRKVTVRKLSFYFRNKARGDNPGVLRVLDEGLGLRKLDEMDNLACVLRLRAGGDVVSDEVEEEDDGGGGAREESDAAFEEYTIPELEQDAYGSEEGQEPSDSSPNPMPPRTFRAPGEADLAKFHEDHAWWAQTDSTYRNVRPLGPPLKVPLLHYPTISYRRQRIPLYDLPTLLGEEYMAALIRDTVFVDCTYAVMAHSLGAVGAHQWLIRLQDYLARRKDDVEDMNHER